MYHKALGHDTCLRIDAATCSEMSGTWYSEDDVQFCSDYDCCADRSSSASSLSYSSASSSRSASASPSSTSSSSSYDCLRSVCEDDMGGFYQPATWFDDYHCDLSEYESAREAYSVCLRYGGVYDPDDGLCEYYNCDYSSGSSWSSSSASASSCESSSAGSSVSSSASSAQSSSSSSDCDYAAVCSYFDGTIDENDQDLCHGVTTSACTTMGGSFTMPKTSEDLVDCSGICCNASEITDRCDALGLLPDYDCECNCEEGRLCTYVVSATENRHLVDDDGNMRCYGSLDADCNCNQCEQGDIVCEAFKGDYFDPCICRCRSEYDVEGCNPPDDWSDKPCKMWDDTLCDVVDDQEALDDHDAKKAEAAQACVDLAQSHTVTDADPGTLPALKAKPSAACLEAAFPGHGEQAGQELDQEKAEADAGRSASQSKWDEYNEAHHALNEQAADILNTDCGSEIGSCTWDGPSVDEVKNAYSNAKAAIDAYNSDVDAINEFCTPPPGEQGDPEDTHQFPPYVVEEDVWD